MIYLTTEITIVSVSIGVAIISFGRAAYWRYIAAVDRAATNQF